jgi:hypothetical protein
MPLKVLYSILLSVFFSIPLVHAQTITGEVTDVAGNTPMQDVSVQNIYTGAYIASGTDGKFFIAAEKGQLLEFKKIGYKTVHVRIPDGYVPSYFKIIMQKGVETPQYAKGDKKKYDYIDDSLRFHDIYQHELDFPRLSAVQKIEHPFSALAKQNREIWDFQDDYAEVQKQKYIDYTFNPDIVTKLTGLQGDSLTMYMKRFRPTYEQLRAMNQYNFYNFIKRTVARYRAGNTPRGSRG